MSMLLLTAVLCLSPAPQDGPTFVAHQQFLGAVPERLVLAPLDADATLDAAVTLRTGFGELSLAVFRGTGTGRLILVDVQPYPQAGYEASLRTVDANVDGFTDVAVAGLGVDPLFLGDGTLALAPTTWLPTAGGFGTFDVAFPYIDDDALPDSALLVEDFGWYIDLGLNAGDDFVDFGFFDAPAPAVENARLLFADVNGNGKESLLMSAPSGIFKQDWPDGGFDVTQLTSIGTFELEAADADGDGDADLFGAAPSANGLLLLRNDGLGAFPTTITHASGVAPEALALGDLDGDGDLDVALAHTGSASIGLLLGDGRGGFVPAHLLRTGRRPVDLAAGDLDGDGDLDLVSIDADPMTLTALLNQTVR